jgi:hypothetical protein
MGEAHCLCNVGHEILHVVWSAASVALQIILYCWSEIVQTYATINISNIVHEQPFNQSATPVNVNRAVFDHTDNVIIPPLKICERLSTQ